MKPTNKIRANITVDKREWKRFTALNNWKASKLINEYVKGWLDKNDNGNK